MAIEFASLAEIPMFTFARLPHTRIAAVYPLHSLDMVFSAVGIQLFTIIEYLQAKLAGFCVLPKALESTLGIKRALDFWCSHRYVDGKLRAQFSGGRSGNGFRRGQR